MDGYNDPGLDFYDDNSNGFANALIANLDSSPATYFGDPAPEPSQINQNVQFNVPICVNDVGGECQAMLYWRQRCELVMTESNSKMVSMNNLLVENHHLKSRLSRSKESLSSYQTRLCDTFNSLEPIRKELDETKNKLLAEVCERSKFQCEAEAYKSSIAALQQENLQLQMSQGNSRNSAVETKMQKLVEENKMLKNENKAVTEENVRLRKLVESSKSGMPVPARARGRGGGRRRGRGGRGRGQRAVSSDRESLAGNQNDNAVSVNDSDSNVGVAPAKRRRIASVSPSNNENEKEKEIDDRYSMSAPEPSQINQNAQFNLPICVNDVGGECQAMLNWPPPSPQLVESSADETLASVADYLGDLERPLSQIPELLPSNWACDTSSSSFGEDNRVYAGILKSMLSADSDTTNEIALDEWMKEPKSAPATVVYCFLEAVKSFNSSFSINTQFNMGENRSESCRRRSLRVHSKKVAASMNIDFQKFSANDQKLADLLNGLLSKDDGGEWKSVPAIMLSRIKWELASKDGNEMNADEQEALCRWCFYLCRQQRSLVSIKEILLIVVRRDDQFRTSDFKNRYLNIFLALAIYWPSAFRAIVVEPRVELSRILQSIFCYLLQNSPSKIEAKQLLDRQFGSLEIIDREPDFEKMILEQTAALARAEPKFELTETGVRFSEEFSTRVNKLTLLAPYCDEGTVSNLVESCFKSIIDWQSTVTNEKDSQKKRAVVMEMVSGILILSKMALFSSSIVVCRTNFDALLKSLRSIIFDTAIDETTINDSRRFLICAAADLFLNLPSTAIWGKEIETRNFLEEVDRVMEKEENLMEDAKKYYRKRYMEFCGHRKAK